VHVSRMTVLGLTAGVIAVGLFAGLLATARLAREMDHQREGLAPRNSLSKKPKSNGRRRRRTLRARLSSLSLRK